MFNLILSAISFSLCCGFPFLLTLKLINQLDIKSDMVGVQVNQLRFLFNYWVYYVIVTTIENSILLRVIDLSLFNIGEAIFFLIKIWLFYGKGCLVLSYYYVNYYLSRLLGNNTQSNLEILEVRFIDPIANLITMNTVLLNHGLNFLNHLTGSNNLVNSIVLNFQYFILTLSNNHKQGNLRSPYFIGASLQYFCTIDNLVIYKQYKLTNQFLSLFTFSRMLSERLFSPPSSRNPSRKSSNPTINKKSRVSSTSQPIAVSLSQSSSNNRSNNNAGIQKSNSNGSHHRSNSSGSHHRSNSTGAHPRPVFVDYSPSPTSTPRVFLSPDVSPRLAGRTFSLTETLDDLERLDDTSSPHRRNSEAQSDFLKVAIEEALKSKGIHGSSIPKSDSNSQLNMPPNSISIDKVLNEKFVNDRNRSRSSSILSNPPYPVN